MDDDDDFITTSLPKLTSAQHRKARDNPGLSSAGGVSTPKRSRVVGGGIGSAKRKQTSKSKKSKSCSGYLLSLSEYYCIVLLMVIDSVQQEEWSEEDMKVC